jgi:hypothetical protein
MGRNIAYTFFLFFLFILLLVQGTAHADVFTGSAELSEQIGRTRDVSSEGLTSITNSTYFFQRYRLDYNDLIFPRVFLRAGLHVDKTFLNGDTDGNKSKQTETVLMPSAGLTFANPFVVAGVGYDKRDDNVESGESSSRTIRETNNAFLGLRPEGLPTVDLLYTGQKRHDADHKSIDVEDRFFSLNTAYRPIKSIQLYYTGSYDDNEQHLTQSETKTLSQSAKVGYGDRFFDDRMTLSTNYNITRQDIQLIMAGAGGTVQVQLFPLAGLSAINETPVSGVLNANPALIDGNLTASSGMNIGQNPSLGGDIKKRNAGLDFGLPLDVSSLFVWVDRQLPSDVVNTYVWEIYTSQDNENWSLYQTVSPATFGLFDNRFELAFASVMTRYIMVVTSPLSVAVVPPPGVDVSNLFITELQAFNDQPVSTTAGSTTTTARNTESVDVNTKVHIIRSDRHTLMYDLYYVERKVDQTGQPLTRASTLTNALTLNEKFNRVLSGNARVMRQEDESSGGGSLTTYTYDASLAAAMNSLPKLAHIAVLSGKREELVETRTTKDTGTLSLTNTAEVYPGINAHLSGIETLISTTTDTSLGRTAGTLFSFSADIVPHRTITINLTYEWSEQEQRGSDNLIVPAGVTVSRRQSSLASVGYNPLSSLYLYGSIQRIEETGKPGITYGYFSGGWSAQRTGGALELRFSYADNVETESRTRTRNYGPSAKWKINPRAFLEIAYSIATIDTPLNKTETTALYAKFKMNL